jgi:predicted TPR repeat methyltransferase
LAKSLDQAAAAEARRQIVALAEALARQVAREDDAAEDARDRSRSRQDMPAEELPSQPAKDDAD